MTNAYENANLIKCLNITHDAHTQPPMITKTMLQMYGPHLQQDITSTRSASLKKIPCSAYPVMHEDIAAQFIKNTQNQTKNPQVVKSSGHPQVMKYSSSKPQVVNSSQNPKVANSSSNPQIMKFCYPQVTNPS
jgi:hypothetical protein